MLSSGSFSFSLLRPALILAFPLTKASIPPANSGSFSCIKLIPPESLSNPCCNSVPLLARVPTPCANSPEVIVVVSELTPLV